MPLKRHLYPPDWEEISLRIRWERAGGFCEFCGIQNYSLTERGTKVVLTTAHLNHDKGCDNPTNLAALCQRCHFEYDRKTTRKPCKPQPSCSSH